ncbi:MAG: hypothetical protein HRU75_02675 [Planctomycetia bacterium]|nr:MAG: hypothetical protein HRU75_02675 [Planctomycetia bacterium]
MDALPHDDERLHPLLRTNVEPQAGVLRLPPSDIERLAALKSVIQESMSDHRDAIHGLSA